ncbi:hypothetical protein Pmar_PMAR018640 [Perkinsus marinus ATCC 50983]|uniref:Uncharacterized protein n=1 Tax=Perkinsus marinus (strain ATCC 50983 / TXsc) TaxID=423536 RepID=C5L0D7_PERM5|nr:hypothetical protein Pmar_PMAR018640 [Perkinsus marinus ATCC 50983]EER09995.1 hypothetical protein Pmar_PMAR018640 [Perkinsus marinus ATCC 50983]|eukprot:XP_002778200.1 hypothetical protein Pmar_PMAR018640 [Perkinsus marinus ATCC 50983]
MSAAITSVKSQNAFIALQATTPSQFGITPLDKALENPVKHESEIKYHVMMAREKLPCNVLARVIGHSNVMRCLLDVKPSPFASETILEALGQCSVTGDYKCCGALMGALKEPGDLLSSALRHAVVNGNHRVAMLLLGKCDPDPDVLREAFCRGDSRMFGLLVNLSPSVNLGIGKLFDGDSNEAAQRRLLEAVVCSGLVADRLNEDSVAAVLERLPSEAQAETLKIRTPFSRFRFPDRLAASCGDCGVQGFLVGPPKGLFANLPIIGSRANSRSAYNCDACGSAICGICRRVFEEAQRPVTLCRECSRSYTGLWGALIPRPPV